MLLVPNLLKGGRDQGLSCKASGHCTVHVARRTRFETKPSFHAYIGYP